MNARNLLLAITSGLLSAASFPPIGVAPLAWIAWVPLLLAIHGRDPRPAFALGFVAGLIANLGTFHWIVVVVHTYGHAPLLFALLALLLMSLYLALYQACWAGGIARALQLGEGAAIWLGAALWVGLELVRAHTISGFPWALAGYSQAPFTSLIQIAEWTGPYGVSFLLILANLAIAAVLWRWTAGRPVRRALRRLVLLGGLLGVVWLAGAFRQAQITLLMSDEEPLRVAVVQGNIPQDVKWSPESVVASLSRHLALTADAAESFPHLIVWPEAAVTFFFQNEEALADLIFKASDEAGAPIFFGGSAYDEEESGTPRVRYYNSAFLVAPGEQVEGRYDKIHLVPFGEYVPFREQIRFVSRVATGIAGADMTAGGEAVVFSVAGRRFGALICYESIFPELSRALVAKGADFLVNITNDAWFGRSGAPGQHLQMAIFRAVENRVGIARAANTGFSALIQPTGEVIEKTKLFTMTQFTAPLSTGGLETFYTRRGDVFAWGCAILGLAAIIPFRPSGPSKRGTPPA